MKKNIPNALTCCNLISGCIATTFALSGHVSMALALIIVGAVFDFFDGMSARLLHVSSPIGKELDSLADDITFGVAPSSIIYWFLSCHLSSPILPYMAFVMAAFSALRLAKFNLDERQATSFIGLPTPANALFWGALLAGGGHWIGASAYGVYGVIAMMLLCCWLLVAEIPMFALKFKHWGWQGNEIKYLFMATSVALILWLHTIGIAAVIAWYVALSVATCKRS